MLLSIASINAIGDLPSAKVTRFLNSIGIRTYAVLNEVAINQLTDFRNGNEIDSIGRVDLQNQDLAFVRAERAVLVNADLRNTNLQRAVLSGANLQGVRLNSANLQGANLTRAKLQGSHLNKANLQSAILKGAKFEGADLKRADLRATHLFSAGLAGANLQDANLQGADLRSSNLWHVQLGSDYRRDVFWNLADLRFAKAKVIDDLDSWVTNQVKQITIHQTREIVTSRLRSALVDRNGSAGTPNWRDKPNVLFDRNNVIAKKLGWNNPTMKRSEFEEAFASFFGRLACKIGASKNLVAGIAQLIIFNKEVLPGRMRRLAAQLSFDRPGACPSITALSDEIRDQLAELAAELRETEVAEEPVLVTTYPANAP